ncbi:hypothetical protein LTR84_008821 [Exophiala bonariae]|uniref:Alpha/beta hydrolase fold-3 domain-containing protein n=1 Tax=Exophiala bonariae TaxID=1690606 RepID=A0AAV9N065_9EURO|nr:hypothetical protein LTR84_008821 [Exophiala bonariae]
MGRRNRLGAQTRVPRLYGQHVVYSASRVLLDLMPVNVGQALNGTTSGGYTNAATEQHFVLLLELTKLAREKARNLRVLIPEYDLAPHGLYPTQLRQGVASLRYLLDRGLQPSQIILGGDSAGGNLLGALLLHLSHPHSEVPVLLLKGHLNGAIFMSPWITFQTNSPSFRRNQTRDIVGPRALTTWSKAFLGGHTRDNYNHPIDAPADWWNGVKAEKMAFVAGAHEVFVDDIRTMMEKVKVHNPSLEYLEAADEAHDAAIVDRAYGLNHELTSDKFIQAWILERLS